MKKEDEAIIRFCVALAQTAEMFRSAHIEIENKSFLKEVGTTISHSRGKFDEASLKGRPNFGERFVEGVSISYSLDAELLKMIDEDKYSMGVSITIRSFGDHWVLQAEVGWSCRSCGWDNCESFEQDAADVEAIVSMLPSFCEKVLLSYRMFVNKIER